MRPLKNKSVQAGAALGVVAALALVTPRAAHQSGEFNVSNCVDFVNALAPYTVPALQNLVITSGELSET